VLVEDGDEIAGGLLLIKTKLHGVASCELML